jgi:hypothetical protein
MSAPSEQEKGERRKEKGKPLPFALCLLPFAKQSPSSLDLAAQFIQLDCVFSIGLEQFDLDQFLAGGGNVFANVIGTDGQFTVSSVYQHRQLDARRATQIYQGIQPSPSGAPGVKHIVHHHNAAAADVKWHLGLAHNRLQANFGQIIAVKRDVEFAIGNLHPLEFGNFLGNALGYRDATCMNTDNGEVICAFVAFDDFVGNARDGTTDVVRLEQPRFEFGVTHGLPQWKKTPHPKKARLPLVFALFLLCVSLDTTLASLGKFKVGTIYKVAFDKSRGVVARGNEKRAPFRALI